MSRTRTVLAAAATVLALAAGCSSDSDAPKPSPATKKAAASTKPATPAKLSTKWIPKLEKATAGGGQDICLTVGSPECTAHLTDLTLAAYDLEDAITTAGVEADYPESIAQIRNVERASDTYVAEGCEGSSEPALGSTPCATATQTILAGPGMLTMNLELDEIAAGG